MELRFILVANCNFNCYFCLNEYYGGKEATYLLKPNDYAYISKIAKHLGIDSITLTGGEPTLRKDLTEITEKLSHHIDNITIITNGVLIDKRLDAFNFVNEVHISFHSFNDTDWERITGAKGENRQIVQDNIMVLRNAYPDLRIKLNIVSEEANNSKTDIIKYLEFAKEYNLEINVFQEGYFKMFELLGIHKGNLPKPSGWWDLSFLEKEIIGNSPRKETFRIDGVILHTSYTSTDFQSWDSIWVSPKGDAYCNIFQNTPVINIHKVLNDDKLCISAIKSLLDEANYNCDKTDSENYNLQMQKLINQRINTLPISLSNNVTNLMK